MFRAIILLINESFIVSMVCNIHAWLHINPFVDKGNNEIIYLSASRRPWILFCKKEQSFKESSLAAEHLESVESV